MALIACPECEKQISDKAIACPNCGYPVRERQQETAPTPPPIPVAPKTPTKKPEEQLPAALDVRRVTVRISLWRKRAVKLQHRCPTCGHTMQADPHLRGRKLICRRCEAPFRIATVAEARATSAAARPASTAQRYDGCAITGFVLGLASPLVLLASGGYLPIIIPILAVVFSGIGMSRTRDGQRKGRGLAVTGLVIGVVLLIGAFMAYAKSKGEWPY